jgi:hypothetical protein
MSQPAKAVTDTVVIQKQVSQTEASHRLESQPQDSQSKESQKSVPKNVVSCEPWPAQGIKSNSSIADYDWGYLRYYSDGQFDFDAHTRPSNQEIVERWGIYFD